MNFLRPYFHNHIYKFHKIKNLWSIITMIKTLFRISKAFLNTILSPCIYVHAKSDQFLDMTLEYQVCTVINKCLDGRNTFQKSTRLTKYTQKMHGRISCLHNKYRLYWVSSTSTWVTVSRDRVSHVCMSNKWSFIVCVWP